MNAVLQLVILIGCLSLVLFSSLLFIICSYSRDSASASPGCHGYVMQGTPDIPTDLTYAGVGGMEEGEEGRVKRSGRG